MPHTELQFYQEANGEVPLVGWLKSLPAKVQDKCLVKLERLEALGYELRRPEADYLRDDIYELRVRFQRVNYRMLYFFFGAAAVVVRSKVHDAEKTPALRCPALLAPGTDRR